MKVVFLAIVLIFQVQASPYPDQNKVQSISLSSLSSKTLRPLKNNLGFKVLRVQVDWDKSESFKITHLVKENSGTKGLYKKVLKKDPHGSYQAEIIDPDGIRATYYQSIGTGAYFRKLTRALTFRFPMIKKSSQFILYAENPKSGKMEKILDEMIHPDRFTISNKLNIDSRIIRQSIKKPEVVLSVYADGYKISEREKFFKDAQKVQQAFESGKFPGQDHFKMVAHFYHSEKKLGRHQNLGNPIPERDSFLGLYFPYWAKEVTRWYHIVYPTREERYRSGVGQVAYDYPLILINSSGYWGVGNFKELTAIPSDNSRFQYLLFHEFGHYLGLNEEYESGGPTELAFAPQIDEPWSQNITFLRDPMSLKWKKHVHAETPIPTPRSYWSSWKKNYGAYKGGYARSPGGQSHKPGHSCVMHSQSTFCPICTEAIHERIMIDTGNQ